MQVFPGVFASGRGGTEDVQEEVDSERHDDEQQWLVFVVLAGEGQVGQGGQEADMDDGADEEPEEGAAAAEVSTLPVVALLGRPTYSRW